VAEKYRGKASPESIKNHAGWILSLYPGSLRQFKNGKSFVREM
jgi:hypothetical protein